MDLGWSDGKRGGVPRRPVSRVLYPPFVEGRAAVIYLGPPLPTGSSGQPGDGTDAQFPLLGLAPDGVCLASDVTAGAVSSYLAISPLPELGGVFLWHFPSGHPAPPLAGILSGEARTFLSPGLCRGSDRPATLVRDSVPPSVRRCQFTERRARTRRRYRRRLCPVHAGRSQVRLQTQRSPELLAKYRNRSSCGRRLRGRLQIRTA